MTQRVPSFSPSRVDPESQVLPWWRFIRLIPLGSNIQPVASVVAAMIAWLGTVVVVFTPSTLVVGYTVIFSIWVCLLYLVKWIMTVVEQHLNAISRLILEIVLVIVSAIPGALAAITVAAAMQSGAGRFDVVVAAVLSGSEFVLLIAVAFAVQSQSHASQKQIEAAQEQLDWLEERARLVALYQNKRLAHVLHGPIQAELNVALAQAHQGSSVQVDSRESLRDLTKTLQDHLMSTLAVSDPVDLKAEVARAATLWEGECQINLALEDNALLALNADPVASEACNAIVQDAISSSVRQGKAMTVEITVTLLDLSKLRVEIVDDEGAAVRAVLPIEAWQLPSSDQPNG